MTPWMVELKGDNFDLKELLRLNSRSDIRILEEDGRFYLRANEFNSFTEARDVRQRGIEIVNVLNGIAQLEIENWNNINVHGVARDEPNGTRTQFVFLESIRIRSRVSAIATVIRDGTVVDSEHQYMLETLFTVSQNDSNVEKALRIYGSRDHTWVNLYIIYEVIEGDAGGSRAIINKGWSTESKIENFKRTANSVGAVGDDARHGRERTSPPPNPMSLSEAQSFIYSLLKQWTHSK